VWLLAVPESADGAEWPIAPTPAAEATSFATVDDELSVACALTPSVLSTAVDAR